MNELELAKRFSDDIDRILKDNKAGVAPSEQDREVIELARRLAEMDLSDECRFAGDLRKRLLDRLSAPGKKTVPGAGGESAELNDDELDNVAGGISPHTFRQGEEDGSP